MLLYALGVTPVVRDLDRLIKEMESKVPQCWLADDSSAAGTLEVIRIWWDKLVESSIKYCYYVNAKKTCIILKSEHLVEKAKRCKSQLKARGTLEPV